MQSACRSGEAVITRLRLMASARQGGRRSEIGGQRSEVGGQNFGFRIADFSIEDCVTVRHPGQVSQSGTRAGIQEELDYIQISLDSGSRPRSGLVRNDDFYGFNGFYDFYGFYDFNDFYDLTNSLIP